jgi:hypothetical protein
MNWSWHTNWNTAGRSRCVNTWFPRCSTASTIKWDFGQASHLLRASKRLGLLINFKVALIKDTITRVANGLAEQSSLRLCDFA